MAQNEMKAKPALPERVRSMEGLGVAVTRGKGCVPNSGGSPGLGVIIAHDALGTNTKYIRDGKVCEELRGCGDVVWNM